MSKPEQSQRHRRPASTAKVLAWLCALGFVATIGIMGLRLARASKDSPRTLFAFQRVKDRAFRWADRNVFISDVSENGVAMIEVRYAEERTRFRVARPPQHPGLPGLVPHEEWLCVLRFAEATGLRTGDLPAALATGKTRERLAVVTKSLPPGIDPATWGEVWRSDWHFDFYELTPEGTIAHERLAYPTARAGQPEKPGELHEQTWQFDAALHLMPKGGPKYRSAGTPLAPAGWTLPAGAALVAGAIIFTVMASRGPRPTPPPGTADPEPRA